MKVLVIDDDRFYARRLCELMADNGIGGATANTVQAALQLSLTEYQGIIVDVMLPNEPTESGILEEETRGGFLAGVALCRQIRKLGHKLPMILISAATHTEAIAWASEQNIPFVCKDEGPHAILRSLKKVGILTSLPAPRAFIVHGSDDKTVSELKDYLQNTLKWDEPVILREQPHRGRSIIEKFEDYSVRIDCVFILLTPDDSGINLSTDEDKRRARQNVIFELGFFYGQMGRNSGRIIVLKKGVMELPSDIQGVVWIDISKGIMAAGEEIRREVAGISR